jgi:hypothetical protein
MVLFRFSVGRACQALLFEVPICNAFIFICFNGARKTMPSLIEVVKKSVQIKQDMNNSVRHIDCEYVLSPKKHAEFECRSRVTIRIRRHQRGRLRISPIGILRPARDKKCRKKEITERREFSFQPQISGIGRRLDITTKHKRNLHYNKL